jgi:hypothetical protein
LLFTSAASPFLEIFSAVFVPIEDGHEGKATMEIIEDINVKMGAFAIEHSVRETFLPGIV